VAAGGGVILEYSGRQTWRAGAQHMQNDRLVCAEDDHEAMDALGEIWSDESSFVDALQDDFDLALSARGEGCGR
jgi:hypothetical protein